MGPVFALSGICRSFGDGFSLQDIDLDVYSGEVHVIVGENGSGKSAAMKVAAGLYLPDSGRLLLEGRPMSYASIAEAKTQGVLYHPQDPSLFENLSVAENLFFDSLPRKWLGGLDVYKLHADAAILLKRIGVPIDPDLPVRALGYAQRQLLEAAKTCVGSWKVVAFDEPTAAMADPEREVFFSLIRRLKDAGVGVFYVSHRLDEILKIGDRVSVVRQGRVAATRSVGDLDSETLVRIMTGRLMTERYPRFDRSIGSRVLEVRNLKSDNILDGVSFDLHKREILGITGLMGSGRTRLAQCLCGAIEPSGGEIVLAGEKIRFREPGEALDKGLALVPEDRTENAIIHRQDLVMNVTVASLRRFLGRTGLDEGFMRTLTSDYATRLGVNPGQPGDRPDEYSGGNQQKVAVARVMARRARIFIMDEPTRGIDIASKVDVYNAVADLAGKGASVLFISSDIEEILGLCDRVLVLAGGKIACDLPRGEATQELILEYATTAG